MAAHPSAAASAHSARVHRGRVRAAAHSHLVVVEVRVTAHRRATAIGAHVARGAPTAAAVLMVAVAVGGVMMVVVAAERAGVIVVVVAANVAVVGAAAATVAAGAPRRSVLVHLRWRK